MPGDTSKERHFVVQSQVLQRYYAERPKNKREIEAFIHKTATELEIRPKTVERYVVDEEAAVIRQIEAQKVTAAQQIADLIGASQAKAIRKLNTLMDAKKRRIMKDSHGNAVREYDEKTQAFTGKVVYETSEDNPTQLAAVREVLKIHGSYAPEQIEVTSTSTNLHMHMSEPQLFEQVQKTMKRINELSGSGSAVGTGGTAEAGNRTVDSESNFKPMVLVDGVYEDLRRAGSGESA